MQFYRTNPEVTYNVDNQRPGIKYFQTRTNTLVSLSNTNSTEPMLAVLSLISPPPVVYSETCKQYEGKG